ncbi:DUF2206 domain-containing protein [Halorubrum coriense]|uniref:DUF2206 domain-containing protein n=1 Tax=Halorubrum coriense TaxID=64713 RepID=UPI001378C2B6|nr:DUF2206 domain-containing protein [Halorubrum coriense]
METRLWSRVGSLNHVETVLYCFFLLSLAAAGAKLQYSGITPFVAYLFVILAASTPLLLVTGIIPVRSQMPVVYSLGLAVHWHTTLVTNHLWGWDIHFVYYIAQQTQSVGSLILETSMSVAGLVVVTWFSAFLSEVLNIQIVTVMKVVLPMIAAMTPVAIFAVTRRIDSYKAAPPLAAAAFIFFYRYFKVMPNKQALGELFIALLLLCFVVPAFTNRRWQATIPVILAAGLVLAHYATTLIYLTLISGAMLLGIIARLYYRDSVSVPQVVTATLIPAGVGWTWYYLEAAQGRVLVHAVAIGFNAVRKIAQLLGIVPSSGSAVANRSGSGYLVRLLGDPLYALLLALTAGVLGLAVLGVLSMLYVQVVERREEPELFLKVAVTAIGLMGAGVVLTFGLGFDRLISIVLVVLAPTLLAGAFAVRQFFQKSGLGLPRRHVAVSIAVLLGVWLVVGSGLAWVGTDTVPSYAIGINEEEADWRTYSDSEVSTVAWAHQYNGNDNISVFSYSRLNSRDGLLVAELFYRHDVQTVSPGEDEHKNGCGMFYTSHRPMRVQNEWVNPEQTEYYRSALEYDSRYYDSGKGSIYSC